MLILQGSGGMPTPEYWYCQIVSEGNFVWDGRQLVSVKLNFSSLKRFTNDIMSNYNYITQCNHISQIWFVMLLLLDNVKNSDYITTASNGL